MKFVIAPKRAAAASFLPENENAGEQVRCYTTRTTAKEGQCRQVPAAARIARRKIIPIVTDDAVTAAARTRGASDFFFLQF
jgi:hypothetical protein